MCRPGQEMLYNQQNLTSLWKDLSLYKLVNLKVLGFSDHTGNNVLNLVKAGGQSHCILDSPAMLLKR